MTGQRIAAVVAASAGLLGVLIAVILVLAPVSAGGVPCGNHYGGGVAGTPDEFLAGELGHKYACQDATNNRHRVALAIGIPGAALILAGGVAWIVGAPTPVRVDARGKVDG